MCSRLKISFFFRVTFCLGLCPLRGIFFIHLHNLHENGRAHERVCVRDLILWGKMSVNKEQLHDIIYDVAASQPPVLFRCMGV